MTQHPSPAPFPVGSGAGARPGAGALAAYGQPVFRGLLLIQLGNAIGVWMHVVAVQWILTESGRSATVVALAPAAMSVPFLVLALPMGVIVGYAARERLMAAAMGVSGLACLTAWGLAGLGAAHPAALLGTVLAVGTALVSIGVAWQSLLPETVEKPLVASAAVMDGAAFNLARAVGPILAGAGLAVVAPGAVFAMTAVLFLVCSLAMAAASRRRPGRRHPRQPLLPALRTGLRFVRHSPWTRRLLLRMMMFGLPSSALWALVSLVAHDRLALGSRDFGFLMAMLGIGALVAASCLARIRSALGINGFVVLGSGVYASALVVMATVPQPVVVAGVLLLAGMAWVGVQSTWMTLAHQALPDWVRPRVIALILLLFQAAQAGGAVLWGRLADAVGLTESLLLAAGLMVLSMGAFARSGLYPSAGIEPRPAATTPLEVSSLPVGHVLAVEIEYAVAPDSEADFLVLALELRRSRLRLGARRWELVADPMRPGFLVERYQVDHPDDYFEQATVRLTIPELAVRHRLEESALSISAPRVLAVLSPVGRRTGA